jgi:hypothetical protein
MITVQAYRDITQDLNTPAEAVSAFIEEATDLVEEYLERTLRHGTYTEELEIWSDTSGRTYVYPHVTPITSVPSGVVYTIDVGARRLMNVFSSLTSGLMTFSTPGIAHDSSIRPEYVIVTYDGGFTSTTLPRTIARAIARTARNIAITNPLRIIGATEVAVGDVRVKYQPFTGDLEALVPGISLALKPYKRWRLRF